MSLSHILLYTVCFMVPRVRSPQSKDSEVHQGPCPHPEPHGTDLVTSTLVMLQVEHRCVVSQVVKTPWESGLPCQVLGAVDW